MTRGARRWGALLAGMLAFVGVTGARAGEARAAEPWVSRPITLPMGTFAFDGGLGVAHVGSGVGSFTGGGANLEGAVGITSHLQLGVRTGLRFGTDGKILSADNYGRLFDAETFGVGNDAVANPEVSLTGAIVRAEIVEVALQGRVYLPFEANTRPGLMFGVPVMLHLGGIARIDTGGYVPFVFTDPIQSGLVVPVDVWFQASRRFWIGPITGLRFRRHGTDLRAGAGLGYQIASFLDFKAQFYFPAINQDSQAFGFGAGLQIRIE